jgi:hypothetical protein
VGGPKRTPQRVDPAGRRSRSTSVREPMATSGLLSVRL